MAATPTNVVVGGSFGVPVDAVAVVVNVTAVDPVAAGFVTVWPAGDPMPTTSNLNVQAGVTSANLVVATLGRAGALSISISSGYADVLVDVVGWFDASGPLAMVKPARAFDSRTSGGRLGAKDTRAVRLAGVAGVPVSGVDSVVINLTAARPTAASFLTVYPGATARPVASNLNVQPGLDTANLVIAKLGLTGAVEIYNDTGAIDVVVDVVGYLKTGSAFTSVVPMRVLDSRTNRPFDTFDDRVVVVGGSGNAVAVVNLTSTDSTNDSFVTAWPGGTRPNVSSINPRAGATVANLALVSTIDGAIHLFNSAASSHLIVDVLGFLPAAGAGYHAVEPARAFDSRPTVFPAASVRHGFVVPAGTNASYARAHSGYNATDVFAACGTPLLSPVDGIVSEVRRVDAYSPAHPATFGGRSVAVVGDDGVRYYGSHYDTIGADITPGHRVAVGDQLGTMGRTGDTNVCHVHFGLSVACPGPEWSVRRGVVWPWPYLDAWRAGANVSPATEIEEWRAANPTACLDAMADPDASAATGP
jgi:murein DD-endopeptidase MepM/ murein hydrolase activator NlpD